MGPVRKNARPGENTENERDNRHGQRVGPIAGEIDNQTARRRADQSTQAPEAVTGGHDRSTLASLHFHRVGIHRHVRSSHGRAHQGEGHCTGDGVWHDIDQNKDRRDDENHHPQQPMGAVPRDPPADKRHRRHRAETEKQDHQPDGRFLQSQFGREFRYFRRPVADQIAVLQEHQCNRRSLRGKQRKPLHLDTIHAPFPFRAPARFPHLSPRSTTDPDLYPLPPEA